MTFEGRVACVTGGGSGLGRETAARLARQGAAVLVADLRREAAGETVAAIAGEGGRALAFEVDVADEASAAAMCERAAREFGGLDILVTSAGIGVQRSALNTSAAEFERVLAVNLTGTFLCCKAAAPIMRKHGYGRIVTIASMAGCRAISGRAAYAASKAGVVMLTSVLAIEWAPYGITVNCVAPGPVETAMVKTMHTATTRASFNAAIPLARYGEPAEIAAAVTFLASEEASYITGHTLPVDGGFTATGVIFDPDAQG